MKYYDLVEKDRMRTSWVVYELIKKRRKHQPSNELPSVIYHFLGTPPDGELRFKEEYLPVQCKTCGRYDDDSIFEIGFQNPVTIRLPGDFGRSDDRIFLINQKFLSVLESLNAVGYETKPVGADGWFALNATCRVGSSDSVMELVGPSCDECGRAQKTRGSFTSESQLDLPAAESTVFTTDKSYPSLLWDHDIFVTEDIALAAQIFFCKNVFRHWPLGRVHRSAC